MAMISGFRYLFGHSSITICSRECLALPHIRGLSTKLLTKLFVGGLSGNTNEQALKDTFSRCGQVLDARVVINPRTGWSKGHAFVQFASEIEAENAVNQMDGQVLDGKKIMVNYARPNWHDTGVDPPRAVGPPSQILEENKEQEKVGKKGRQKAVSPQSQASKKNEQKKTSKQKEKNEEGKKKKAPSSSNKQTFIEDLNGLQKAVSPQSQASKKNEQKKTSKQKEKNEEGKKKKGPSSLNKQTFIEDLND